LKVRNTLLFYLGNKGIRERHPESRFQWLVSFPVIEQFPSAESFVLEGHSDWVRSCEYSPDGRFIASSSDDGQVLIWDAQTGELQNALQRDEWIYRVIFSSTGLLATLGRHYIKIWDSATHIPRRELHCSSVDVESSTFEDIAFSPAGTLLAAIAGTAVVTWKIPSYEVNVWQVPGGELGVTFSNDGSLLAVSGHSTMTLLNAEDGQVTRTLTLGGVTLTNPRFSPDSRYLAACSLGHAFFVWDLRSEEETPREFFGHLDNVRSISFSPDGARIASGSDDCQIRIWDLEGGRTEEALQVLKGHSRSVLWVDFSPITARSLVSTSKDRTVRIWDLGADSDAIDGDAVAATEQAQHVRHPAPINFVTLSPDGKTIASGCEDGRILLWDGETGRHRQELRGPEPETDPPHDGQVLWLAFSPDSQVLVSTAAENNVLLWDVPSGRQKRALSGHRDWVRSAVFSPGGTQVASASDDGTVRLWDVSPRDGSDGGKEDTRPPYRGHSDFVFCVAFSPDGRYLASAGGDSQIRVRDLRLTDGLEQGDFGKELGPCPASRALTFSPDGDRIVSFSVDHQLRIWDRRSGQCLHAVDAEKSRVRSLQFYGTLSDYILTERGAQLLSTFPGRPLPLPSRVSYGIRDGGDDECWITWKGRNLVFLPKQHRPYSDGISAAWVRGYKAVIGCESGELLLFRFRENVSPDILGEDNPLRQDTDSVKPEGSHVGDVIMIGSRSRTPN
jgi:WD40 repeat protein